MIESNTYIDQAQSKEDLLGAFTAIDAEVASELDGERLQEHFRRFLLRATGLMFYHGPDVPRRFLEELSSAEEGEAFALTNSYLEEGVPPSQADEEILDRRELQQEFVHFSRIVDIPSLQDRKGVERLHTKRLRNSTDLPDPLKVTTELMTVTRSRHLQRGQPVPLPRRRAPGVETTTLDEGLEIQTPEHESDYALFVRGNSRIRRKATFFHRNLLPYLTPFEATLALATYLSEGNLSSDAAIVLIALNEDNSCTQVTWIRPSGEPDSDAFTWCEAVTPSVDTVPNPGALTLDDLTQELAIDTSVGTENDTWSITFEDVENTASVTLEPPNTDPVNIEEIVDDAIESIQSLDHSAVQSIECGHLHLDREIDDDQRAGMRIGIELYSWLQEAGHEPDLRPMVDDDHVIVQLSPQEYTDFFESYLSTGNKFELIPESSPITRAIVVSLFDRLQEKDSSEQLEYRGGNLYFNLSQQTTVELFEDFDGRCDNGCAFFEVGLLVYRTAPERFTEYIHDRFDIDGDLHERIATILSTDISHDARREEIDALYSQFEEVTSPHDPDPEFRELVDDVLTEARTDPPVHLNVLEDYYELQQHKVRELIDCLDVPIQLKSLHYSTANGRVTLEE